MALISLLQNSPEFFLTMVFIVSLLVGSFLNVVIYRLPVMLQRQWREECCEFLELKSETSSEGKDEVFNLSLPRSTCPNCGHMITALENIPVISYLFLGGKCSACKTGISLRYPLIEVLTAVLSLVAAWHFGFSWQTLLLLFLTWALIALTFIDFDQQLLPDNITLPFLWLGIIANYFGLFTTLEDSVLGAVFGYLAFWSVYIIFKILTGKEGMGHGDFKLLSMLGAWLGWQYLPVIIFLSSCVGALVGLTMMMRSPNKESKPIPFGPYIAIAGWIAVFWGADLSNFYLDWANL